MVTMGTVGVTIVLRILLGCLSSLLTQLIYKTASINRQGDSQALASPLLMVLGPNLLLLACSLWQLARAAARPAAAGAEEADLEVGAKAPPEVSLKTKCLWTAVASLLGLLGNLAMNYALMMLPGDVCSMLKASSVFFTAFLQRLAFGRGQTRTQWLGIGTCSLGLLLAGIADLTDPAQLKSLSATQIGFAMALLSQLAGSLQSIAEEKMVKGFAMGPLECQAWQALWSTPPALLALLLLDPVPGQVGLLDAAAMFKNSPAACLIFVAAVAVTALMNIWSLKVAQIMTSVHRKLLNPVSGILLWVWGLAAYYGLGPHSLGAEAMKPDVALEAVGYSLVFLGLAAHGGLLAQLRCAGAGSAAEPTADSKCLEGGDASPTAAPSTDSSADLAESFESSESSEDLELGGESPALAAGAARELSRLKTCRTLASCSTSGSGAAPRSAASRESLTSLSEATPRTPASV